MAPPEVTAPSLQSLVDRALTRSSMTHLTGLGGCAASLLAATALETLRRQNEQTPVVVLTPDLKSAQAATADLRALLAKRRVLHFPAPEVSPFESVRPDRRLALTRAGCLTALQTGQVDVLVTSVAGWLRRCMPPASERALRGEVALGDTVDLAQLAKQLERAGYERAPITEDPGAFTVRGDIIDVWPAGQAQPLRIDLDFDQVATITAYDPSSQRKTQRSISQLSLGPTQESCIVAGQEPAIEERIRHLCDELNLPSSRTRALVEDALSGRLLLGGHALLPAIHSLSSLADYLPERSVLVVEEAALIPERARSVLESAAQSAQQRQSEPHFALEEHLLIGDSLDRSLKTLRVIATQSGRLLGAPSTGFGELAAATEDAPRLPYRSQEELARRLSALQKGQGASLDPLAAALEQELDEGSTVVITTRVRTQAERLQELLEHRGFKASLSSEDPLLLAQSAQGEPRLLLLVSPLARGVSTLGGGAFFLTEEEIFGRRAHRPRKKAVAALKGAVDDLRALKTGDLVVHRDHGIGRYLGLEHKKLGAATIDLLVVEYHGGDKLYLPVYRLNQVQKFSGEQQGARLDRLGGQTFAKTKTQAKKRVRQMADQLLQLYAARQAAQRPPLSPPGDDYHAFEAAFPYEETSDQAAAIEDVVADLQSERVMDRLVCGDVGFGKTEVALRAAYLNVLEGRQVALLCPTTVLAEQHYRTFTERLANYGVTVRALSRFQSRKATLETLAGLKSGTVDVVVGTHRVLSKDVHFKKLGLLVVDEEQRFGVTHKERIKEIRKNVDVLTLSATPIPRTLSLAVSGLRDMSVISTPPVNRRSIRTFTSRFDKNLIRDAIQRELDRGGQVFYVYNRVEGLMERAAMIREMLPHVRIAVGHGQMKERELERTMLDFVEGQSDVLVATAIIESGLDIPRANTMLVDRADLFGLSQLYQLRGRVGRGAERASCYLMLPSDGEPTEETRRRLDALERYTELGAGFHIATLDMELRGAGELLGADQSGFMERIGFELFSQLLEQATTELQGERFVAEVDPEISVDVDALLPEEYIQDIGLRLSLYKRYASAESGAEVADLDDELSDRFGPLPDEAANYSRVMTLKARLRQLRALGLDATGKSVRLHLQADSPIDPAALALLVSGSSGQLSLSPDGRLTRRASQGESFASGILHAERLLSELAAALKEGHAEGS